MITRQEKIQTVQSLLGVIEQAHEIVAELKRRRDPAVEEFTGRHAGIEIDGIYGGKSGDREGLFIEGVAAAWTLDREDEVFMPGSFDRALAKANENPLPLVYSHSTPLFESMKGKSGLLQLGTVKKMWKDKEGLKLQAWIPKPVDAHPILQDIYEKIQHGEMRGLSVGGKFRGAKGKIYDTDLREISVAPNPVNGDALIFKVTPSGEAATAAP